MSSFKFSTDKLSDALFLGKLLGQSTRGLGGLGHWPYEFTCERSEVPGVIEALREAAATCTRQAKEWTEKGLVAPEEAEEEGDGEFPSKVCQTIARFKMGYAAAHRELADHLEKLNA